MGKRGGTAIAAGSDGCVFDGTFAPDGTFTKDETVVTKVYAGVDKVNVAQREYDMMVKVKEATDGVGVVVASAPLIKIKQITAAAWDATDDKLKTRAACQRIQDNQSGPFVGLVTPRISGVLLDLKRASKLVTADKFKDLDGVIMSMGSKNLVHMDFAARNIFYSGKPEDPTLLLGDFGSTISLTGKEDFDKSILEYVDGYKIGGKFMVSTTVDGLTPFAMAMVIGYHALLNGEDYYTKYIKSIRDQKLANSLMSISTETWVYKQLQDKDADGSNINAILNFEKYLEAQYGAIIKLFAGGDKSYAEAIKVKDALRSAVQIQLSQSDKRMFELLKLLYTKVTITPEDIDELSKIWFPKLYGKLEGIQKPAQGGMKRHTKGGNQYNDYETPEEAFRRVDDVQKSIKPGNNIDIEKLGNLTFDSLDNTPSGGKRKTRRRRLNRVKTGRRINGRIGVGR